MMKNWRLRFLKGGSERDEEAKPKAVREQWENEELMRILRQSTFAIVKPKKHEWRMESTQKFKEYIRTEEWKTNWERRDLFSD